MRKTQTRRGAFFFGDLSWVLFILRLILYLFLEGTSGFDLSSKKSHLLCGVFLISVSHWGAESCERSSDIPIGGESLAEQHLMEPSINPDGALPKVDTGCHHHMAGTWLGTLEGQ